MGKAASSATQSSPFLKAIRKMKQIVPAVAVLIVVSLFWFVRHQRDLAGSSTDTDASLRDAIRETPLQIHPVAIGQYSDGLDGDCEALCSLMMVSDSLRMDGCSHMLHYLQFWGGLEPSARHDDSRDSVENMLEIILDGKKQDWYPSDVPILYSSGDKILRVARSRISPLTNGSEGEAHANQVLASLGAVGVPTSRRFVCGDQSYTVKDLVTGSLDTFSLAGELEFTLLAYIYYLPPCKEWRNRWGDSFSFSSVAEHLLKRPHGQGMCSGIHQLAVFAALLRVNEEHNILEEETKQAIEKYMLEASRLLDKTINDEGAWTFSWFDETGTLVKTKKSSSELHVTGHHLEWILICPPEFRPSEESVSRALAWTQEKLSEADPEGVDREICEHMHAIKALAVVLNSTPRETSQDD